MIYVTILGLLSLYLGARSQNGCVKFTLARLWSPGECFALPYEEDISMKSVEIISKQLHIQQHYYFVLMKNRHGISGEHCLNMNTAFEEPSLQNLEMKTKELPPYAAPANCLT